MLTPPYHSRRTIRAVLRPLWSAQSWKQENPEEAAQQAAKLAQEKEEFSARREAEITKVMSQFDDRYTCSSLSPPSHAHLCKHTRMHAYTHAPIVFEHNHVPPYVITCTRAFSLLSC